MKKILTIFILVIFVWAFNFTVKAENVKVNNNYKNLSIFDKYFRSDYEKELSDKKNTTKLIEDYNKVVNIVRTSKYNKAYIADFDKYNENYLIPMCLIKLSNDDIRKNYYNYLTFYDAVHFSSNHYYNSIQLCSDFFLMKTREINWFQNNKVVQIILFSIMLILFAILFWMIWRISSITFISLFLILLIYSNFLNNTFYFITNKLLPIFTYNYLSYITIINFSFGAIAFYSLLKNCVKNWLTWTFNNKSKHIFYVFLFIMLFIINCCSAVISLNWNDTYPNISEVWLFTNQYNFISNIMIFISLILVIIIQKLKYLISLKEKSRQKEK